jgi:heat shock protein HslJ
MKPSFQEQIASVAVALIILAACGAQRDPVAQTSGRPVGTPLAAALALPGNGVAAAATPEKNTSPNERAGSGMRAAIDRAVATMTEAVATARISTTATTAAINTVTVTASVTATASVSASVTATAIVAPPAATAAPSAAPLSLTAFLSETLATVLTAVTPVTQVASAAPAAADETMTPARLPDVTATTTETVAPPTGTPETVTPEATIPVTTAPATTATNVESQATAAVAAPAETISLTATVAGPVVTAASEATTSAQPEPTAAATVRDGTLTPAPAATTTSTPVATTRTPLTGTSTVTASPVVPATVAPTAVESVATVTATAPATAPVAATAAVTATVPATVTDTVTSIVPVTVTATMTDTMTDTVVAEAAVVTGTPVPVDPPAGEPVTAATLEQRWRWLESRYEGDILITPPAGARYWLEWMDNGRMEIVADCNRGIGRYELAGADVTVTFIGMTMAACDDDSLGDLFVGDLRTVVGATLRDGQLVLELQNEAGQMIFVPAD